ncbi:MAG: sulfatase-like hydrolase/transferase [Candidatus Micrarchaeia archaeon]
MQRPNIIFVMLDTVRADVLDIYGGKTKTRTMSKIAKKAAVYENAIAPGTYTVPSHVSLFTGKRVKEIPSLTKDPMKYSDQNTDPFLVKSKYVNESEMTLAKRMRYLGYDTAMFSNNPFVSKATGIANGFGYVENLWLEDMVENNRPFVKNVLRIIERDRVRKSLIRIAYEISRLMPSETLNSIYMKLRTTLNVKFAKEYGFYRLDKGAAKTNAAISRYLSNSGKNPVFMFVNYMEAHEGYPTSLITKRYVEQDKWLHLSGLKGKDDLPVIKEAYSKRIEYLDTQVGRLIGILREKGILDNAVLVLASDHGQAFMEHDIMYHNMFPYNEVSRVPLISAKFEDGKQVDIRERVSNFVGLSALYDSILGIGIGRQDEVNGNLRRDNFVFSDHVGITEVWDLQLLKLIKGRSRYANAIYNTKKYHNTFATAVYYKNFKLVHFFNGNIKDKMYNLSEDPEEKEDIIDNNRSLAHMMARTA